MTKLDYLLLTLLLSLYGLISALILMFGHGIYTHNPEPFGWGFWIMLTGVVGPAATVGYHLGRGGIGFYFSIFAIMVLYATTIATCAHFKLEPTLGQCWLIFTFMLLTAYISRIFFFREGGRRAPTR